MNVIYQPCQFIARRAIVITLPVKLTPMKACAQKDVEYTTPASFKKLLISLVSCIIIIVLRIKFY